MMEIIACDGKKMNSAEECENYERAMTQKIHAGIIRYGKVEEVGPEDYYMANIVFFKDDEAAEFFYDVYTKQGGDFSTYEPGIYNWLMNDDEIWLPADGAVGNLLVLVRAMTQWSSEVQAEHFPIDKEYFEVLNELKKFVEGE